jgi:heme-binding NEAT domain protein
LEPDTLSVVLQNDGNAPLRIDKDRGEPDVAKDLHKGDKVEWETSQGTTQGKVVKKQTTPTTIKEHPVKASKSDPQYIVESTKTGKRAAHKPEALQKS